jgi:putative FmdB family regulatory protein
MPTYEYACAKCGLQFDKVQSIKEKPLAVCPRDVCPRKPWGRGKVRRRISAGGGLIFKGSGFYTTDYRSESYKAAAKKDTPALTAPQTKAGAPKETKHAATGDPGGGSNSTTATGVAPTGPAKEKS